MNYYSGGHMEEVDTGPMPTSGQQQIQDEMRKKEKEVRGSVLWQQLCTGGEGSILWWQHCMVELQPHVWFQTAILLSVY